MKYFVANWKENPRTERQALTLLEATTRAARKGKARVVVCPPDIYLEKLAGHLRSNSRLALGAQAVSAEEAGAHTGEVGPKMLKRLGVRYVLIGHSERRAFGETDAAINAELKQALADGLHAILCVGESAAVHKRGPAAAREFVKGQLQKDLAGISTRKKNLLIAYEPIWAIGAGDNAGPEYARNMAVLIKKEIPSPVLYGGSVNSRNVYYYVQYKEIDGVLVGGASLQATEVNKMLSRISEQS